MNRKVAATSALAFAVGAALLHLYLGRLETERSGGPQASVVVAVSDLAPGAVLTEQAIGIRQVPEGYVDGRRIRAHEVRDALGVPVTTAVAAGEAIVWSDLAGATLKGRQLSGLVVEGMRAVTITSKVNLFEGLLRPGDRVDVLVTLPDVAEQAPATYTLLQNVLVLSVGGDLGAADGDASKGGGSVNLSVSAKDAHELAQAEHKGRLRLALRNPNDIEVIPTPPLPTGTPRAVQTSQPRQKEIEHVR